VVASPSQLPEPAAHEIVHFPAEQSLPTQSDGVKQFWGGTHFGQSGPPQSMSLSLPFVTRSEQVGSAQRCSSSHTPLWQSVGTAQPSPAGHALQAPPPQSLPVSLPLWVPSLQLAAWQVPSLHSPSRQSALLLQC